MSETRSEKQKLVDEFNRKVKELEDSCSHKEISDWEVYYWAPGHLSGCVRICLRCEKIVEDKPIIMPHVPMDKKRNRENY